MSRSIDLIRFQNRLKPMKEVRDNVTNAVRHAQAVAVQRAEQEKEKSKPRRRIVVA